MEDISVTLKIDSSINRFGFHPSLDNVPSDDNVQVYLDLETLPYISASGVMNWMRFFVHREAFDESMSFLVGKICSTVVDQFVKMPDLYADHIELDSFFISIITKDDEEEDVLYQLTSDDSEKEQKNFLNRYKELEASGAELLFPESTYVSCIKLFLDPDFVRSL